MIGQGVVDHARIQLERFAVRVDEGARVIGRNQRRAMRGYGTSCAPAVTHRVEATLKELGFVVTRNNPYAGGFTTRHYGYPARNRHTLQIEINRALYMDERAITQGPGFAPLVAKVSLLIAALARIDPATLKTALAAE